MTFRKLIIDGALYGSDESLSDQELLNICHKPLKNVDFRDRKFMQIISNEAHSSYTQAHFVLQHLALCHTAVISEDFQNNVKPSSKAGGAEFDASSPDELALLYFARLCGYDYRVLIIFVNK
jgi:phospholipid-transporting ATPase